MRAFKKHIMKICIYYKLQNGPWGGGNQFLKALKKELVKRGHHITHEIEDCVDIFLFNSWSMDLTVLKKIKQQSANLKIVHRLDGVPTLYGRSIEDQNYALALNEFSDLTVFQSKWASDSFFRIGLDPNINYAIIHNGVDAEIFNSMGRKKWDGSEPLKIITTSWSNNSQKGFPYYKELDKMVKNNNDITFTFVGRLPDGFIFENSTYIVPQDSIALSKILRDHHVFFQASKNDACSNAMIEAMNCGLPVIYHNSGGNPEICQQEVFGIPMDEDMRVCLNRMKKRYDEIYKNLKQILYSIDIVSDKYLEYFKRLLNNNKKILPKCTGSISALR